MSIIVTDRLSKRYGRRVGIESLSLSVAEGELFGFLGPNGSGKTTTIRVLLGLLRPEEGRAAIFGLDCWRKSRSIKADLGYLPGDLRLYPWMTARQALSIFGAVRGRDLTAQGRVLTDRFNLDLNVRVRNMSKGMRQKLGLVLALAHEPRVAILDEPTAALDPLMQDQLYQHLRNMTARGHTVFFSSHTLSEVEQLCDRVAILREGRLVADEKIETLRRRASREVTIRWQSTADSAMINPPPFLEILQRSEQEWVGTLTGTAPELVRWLSRQPVQDLSIGQPNLESLFRRYYQQGPGSS